MGCLCVSSSDHLSHAETALSSYLFQERPGVCLSFMPNAPCSTCRRISDRPRIHCTLGESLGVYVRGGRHVSPCIIVHCAGEWITSAITWVVVVASIWSA